MPQIISALAPTMAIDKEKDINKIKELSEMFGRTDGDWR